MKKFLQHPMSMEEFLRRLNLRFPASNAGKVMELKTLYCRPQESALIFYNRVSQLVEDTGLHNEPELCIQYINELNVEIWAEVIKRDFLNTGRISNCLKA